MGASYKQLLLAMGRTGIVGFGGGPSVIPLIRHEAVSRFQWIGDDEFGEVLAIANTLPGPIATKIAAYLGYQAKGTLGAVAAVAAHIGPSLLAMIGLFGAMTALAGSSVVAGMIAAVNPVIAVMLGQMTYEFLSKTVKGLGKTVGVAIVAILFALLMWANLNPAYLIIAFILYGFFHYRLVGVFLKRTAPQESARTAAGGIDAVTAASQASAALGQDAAAPSDSAAMTSDAEPSDSTEVDRSTADPSASTVFAGAPEPAKADPAAVGQARKEESPV